jgi:hypothetical protein
MAFYFIWFVGIGFVIGLLTQEKEKKILAYALYVLISISWFFIWGPYAILTLVELIIGDILARKIQEQDSTGIQKNLTREN